MISTDIQEVQGIKIFREQPKSGHEIFALYITTREGYQTVTLFGENHKIEIENTKHRCDWFSTKKQRKT